MNTQSNVKQLLKILVGVAWLDGEIQLEERQYLRQLAEKQNLANDPDLKPWLYELRPVTQAECYNWTQDYLGDAPTSEQCQQLIEAISGLIYSDGDMAMEEAKLLTRLQQLDPVNAAPSQPYSSAIKVLQELYHRWVKG